jgi:sugar/nucleoside kinase (ribokinase family)
MSKEKIIISGVGCALVDLIFKRISFESPGFKKYASRKSGDGGLSPGHLVFTEELEKFSGQSYSEILNELVGSHAPDVLNVGGPSLVSLIFTAQILHDENYDVRFFGMRGNDTYADKIVEMVRQTPLDISNYKIAKNKVTPFTDVFSDPNYDNGLGERTFVNNIGAAWHYTPDQLGAAFFQSHIACFGGTALVPQIHDNLTVLLKQAREQNCITVVNTVFDFRNQKKNPDKPWPLVSNHNDFKLIDVLIMDYEEALKISGQQSMEDAADFFSSTQLSSFIITNGANNLIAYSNGYLFEKTGILKFPTSNTIGEELKNNPGRKGDTTGCGDNFAGGIIASIGMQLKNGNRGTFSLPEAISWGVSAGGNCCFTVGGTYLERIPGELRNRVESIQKEFLVQIKHGKK